MLDTSAPLVARSALGASAGAAGTVLVDRPDLHVQEQPLLPVFSLRASRVAGGNVAGDFLAACGLSLPARPGTTVRHGACALAWVEPRAWWILGPQDEATLHRTPLPKGLYLTDLTARFCVVRVGGPLAATLLASSISLDLSDLAFPDGRCARTKFAEFGAIYLQRQGAEYLVAMDVGLASSLADWLRDAATHLPRNGVLTAFAARQ